MNFTVLWLFVKVFSVNFWGIVSFGAAKASNPRKSPFHQFAKVSSLKSSPLYSILVSCSQSAVLLEDEAHTLLVRTSMNT